MSAAPAAVVTRIGFLDRSATVFEGGSVRALFAVSGEPLDPTLQRLNGLAIRSDAPADRFRWAPYSQLYGIYVLDIASFPDAETGAPTTHDFTLVESDEGLPAGVGLDHERTVFRVTLRDIEPEACSDLALTASGVRTQRLSGNLGPNEVRSRGTAEVRFQGPRRAALRIRDPYFWPAKTPHSASSTRRACPTRSCGRERIASPSRCTGSTICI